MTGTVLITGAAGRIGTVLLHGLADRYDLAALDTKRVPGRRARRTKTTSLRAIQKAFNDADVVIDLAARSLLDTPWTVVYRQNMLATYNVLEASRLAGVRRVIFASSNNVTGGYEREEPYASIVAGRYDGLDARAIPLLRTDMPVRPNSYYAIGKVFGEAACRYYSDRHGLSVICLRIGTVNRQNRPTDIRQFATLLTHRDLLQLIERCIHAPQELRFATFYGVSDNTWRFWDIADSHDAIGYQPQDDAESWRSQDDRTDLPSAAPQ
jgi:nucleoside-diphosphate-sugar epimerase